MGSPLSIIIVNYYSAELILDCLQSFLPAEPAAEIIVVDNSSDAQGREMLLRAFPLLHWIDMGYNAGFARANNAGMRAARGNIYLLLNPDTIIVGDAITACYQLLTGSYYVAAGVQILNEEKQPQISGSRFVKGGLNHLLPIPYLGSFIKWLGRSSGVTAPGVQNANAIEQVDWISGAFLMVKKSAVQRAGLMDEDFFLYAEEVEWCSRLGKTGKLAIFGNQSVIHLEGGSIDKAQDVKEKGYYNLYDKKGLQLMVSNHLRVRKQYGFAWFFVLLAGYTLGVPVFWIAGTVHQLFQLKSPFGSWSRAAAFTKNVMRLWRYVPKIVSGKPFFYKVF